MNRARARLLLAGALVLALLGLALALGRGVFGAHEGPGEIAGAELPREIVAERARAQRAASDAIGAPPEKSVLFGDLHVHTSISMDAFLMSLPLGGGEGSHPAADACDFARYCSALDFWSLNDHAENLTPELWSESVESVRQCNEVAGDPAHPDVVAYLGWEWTQIGETADDHWGHRNVILRDLAGDAIPARPISAEPTRSTALVSRFSLPVRTAMVAANPGDARMHALARYLTEWEDAPRCPPGVPARELPRDCMESAATPGELQAKLRDWGSAALVIPHGTAWGVYTPEASSWQKQLGAGDHDPALQRLIEVYSGHGSSEEYRAWRPVARGEGGALECPAPTDDYTPMCFRAGEVIGRRCAEQGESAEECAARIVEARRSFVAAPQVVNERTVPLASGDDWRDAGQCRDCFLPTWYHRPLGSVQYILALTSFASPEKPWRYRFGFIAASDVHSARPGTGYKEFARRRMADFQRDGGGERPAALPPAELPARALPAEEVSIPRLTERDAGPPDDRLAAYFFTGGLVAVHASARDRGAIWDALERREVYGTSGQRTLLWFDLVNAGEEGAVLPMGSELRMRFAPRFRVRAVGSPKQKPGCPDFAASALPAERLARLCRGECFHPSDERHLVTRIEVVRIRPQRQPGEPVDDLIEDPWRSFACAPDPAGCTVEFADDDFAVAARDAVYYVRAIEEPTPAVNGKGLGCTRNAAGRCTALDAAPKSVDDDRLGDVEERAWSSPIFIDYAAQGDAGVPPASAAGGDASERAVRQDAPPPAREIAPEEFDSEWSEQGDAP